ncbi:uncharacterized protein LOC127749045 [Frankliniella occidentalis]|uniref:Uncharacterized protein LOC127749045 n=1 Tax=Frankliniella occidentalis TaxID=133901 RepID=A0A9C6U1P0_FRAOC|nr:uncharacterized protein LOC127749045 [Frankliniella occidentalis]
MLSGIGYSGEWFTSPELSHFKSDTTLLAARQKVDTWENLQAKGLLLVDHSAMDTIVGNFQTAAGRTVFNIMLTYVGGLVLAEDEALTYAKTEGDRQIIDTAHEVFPLSQRQKS